MASGGIGSAEKRQNSFLDRSFEIHETWSDFGRNLVIVLGLAVTVWMFCAGMRFAVGFGVNHLMDPVAQGETAAPLVMLSVLLIGGVVRGALFTIPSWQQAEGDGVATALRNVHDTYHIESAATRYEQPTMMGAVRRVLLTILTVGTGGSGGLEAPVLPIGEQISSWWSKRFGVMSPDDLRMFQMAGLSAAVASLLDAPFTAALFVSEVIYGDKMVYRIFIYSLLSATVAFALNNSLQVFEPLFEISAHTYRYSLVEYVQVALVATVISAPAGFGVQWVFRRLKALVGGLPAAIRPALGALGVGMIGLSLWFGLDLEPRHVLGVGEETLKELMSQEGNPQLRVWWVLVLLVIAKIFATGLTLMAGGSAGMLVPAMFIGGVSGAAVHYMLTDWGFYAGPDPSLFVVAGIASGLVGVIEVPLAAITLVMEVFGAQYGPPAIVAVVVCHLALQRLNLYEAFAGVERGDGHEGDAHHDEAHSGHSGDDSKGDATSHEVHPPPAAEAPPPAREPATAPPAPPPKTHPVPSAEPGASFTYVPKFPSRRARGEDDPKTLKRFKLEIPKGQKAPWRRLG